MGEVHVGAGSSFGNATAGGIVATSITAGDGLSDWSVVINVNTVYMVPSFT